MSVHPTLYWWMAINNFHFPKNTNLSYACEKYVVKNQGGKKTSLLPKNNNPTPKTILLSKKQNRPFISVQCWASFKAIYHYLDGKGTAWAKYTALCYLQEPVFEWTVADKTKWFYWILFSYKTFCL